MLACELGSTPAELARTCAVHEIDGCQQGGLGGIRNRRMDFENEDSWEGSAEHFAFWASIASIALDCCAEESLGEISLHRPRVRDTTLAGLKIENVRQRAGTCAVE